MTEPLFREDAYLRACTAVVTEVGTCGIRLDRTVFYPEGGGQPGDTGQLRLPDGSALAIIDTRKTPDRGILHKPADGAPLPEAGTALDAEIDWNRRFRHMRMHTCLHLMCSLVDGEITGAQIGDGKGRIDFNLPDTALDKPALQAALDALIARKAKVAPQWIDEAELNARPELIRTLTVRPPSGAGRVRLLEIEGLDLQPCGGTHVANTGEIGPVVVGKIENKGRQNRRINLRLDQ